LSESAGVAGQNVKLAASNARDKADVLREKLPEGLPSTGFTGSSTTTTTSARTETETPAGESTGEATLRQRPL
jgi:hypothetical protein